MQSLFYRFNQNKLEHNKLQILGLQFFDKCKYSIKRDKYWRESL